MSIPESLSMPRNEKDIEETQVEHEERTSESQTSFKVITEDELLGTSWLTWARNWNRIPLDGFYAEALEKYGAEAAIEPNEERKVVRKVDWRILPILSVCYVFYYVDKITLSYAAIFGIREDLNLRSTEYSLLSSLFYVGWPLWGIPSNILMLKSPAGKYLALNVFIWGVLLMCQAASHNFTQIAILRVLSGAFEAVGNPAFMLITTAWYTRPEQPSRIATWYCSNGLGVAGGGLLGYAIGNIKGGLASWRYEFLVVGALCTAWSVVLWFFLPDSPPTARWLGREERLIAVARLRKNQTGVDTKVFKWDQVTEAFFHEPKTWIFFFLGFMSSIPNSGISNFSTLIIQGLGFDTLQTALLGIPQGALIVIWVTSAAYLNTRLPPNSRTLVAILYMLPTICGSLGFLLIPQHASVGRLVCYYMTSSYQGEFVIILSLVTSNTAGQTKKQITSAMIWLGSCLANISGPFLYRTQDAPEYRLGVGSLLVANCLTVLTLLVLRLYLWHENRKRDRKVAQQVQEVRDSEKREVEVEEVLPHVNDTAFSDLTDRQNPNFRYVY